MDRGARAAGELASAAGRKTIEERYSAEVVADMFAEAVRSTLG